MYHREIITKDKPIRILCATDFSSDSDRAFRHALAMSIPYPTELTLLHVGTESRHEVPWHRYPDCQQTLMQWGKISPDSPASVIEERLEIQVQKRAMRDEDPAFGIIDHIHKFPTDLLVMSTHPPTGFARLVKRSVAGQVLRAAQVNALLLPEGCRGFIDQQSGDAKLSHILWPIDHEPDPRPAMSYAIQLLEPLLNDNTSGSTLYVGERRTRPDYRLPTPKGIDWYPLNLDGDVVPRIFEAANKTDSDLVVMPTAGREDIKEKVKGSTVEQVLRWLGRPLLALPSE